jgi:hypothetical protein
MVPVGRSPSLQPSLIWTNALEARRVARPWTTLEAREVPYAHRRSGPLVGLDPPIPASETVSVAEEFWGEAVTLSDCDMLPVVMDRTPGQGPFERDRLPEAGQERAKIAARAHDPGPLTRTGSSSTSTLDDGEGSH